MQIPAQTQGGLRLAFAELPPTLTPHAILSVAPRPDRRLSALAALSIYLAAAAGAIFLGRGVQPLRRSNSGGVERIYELRPDRPFDLPPPRLPLVHPVVATTAPLPETRPLPLDSDIPPEIAPERLPTNNHSKDNTRAATEDELHSGRVNALPLVGTVRETAPLSGLGTGSVRDFTANPPRIRQAVNPAYPALARATRTQGPVELLMTIDERGVPNQVQVLSGHAAFHAEAERAARLWRFEPATMDGQPVPARFKLIINFRLN